MPRTVDRPWAPMDQRPSQRDGSERHHPDQRVVFARGWLPDPDALEGVELPGVAELQARHHELLDDLASAKADLRALRAKYSAEDAAVEDHWASGEEGKLPAVTDQAVRIATQRAAADEVAAAEQAVLDFVKEALAAFNGIAGQWDAHLEARANRAATERTRLEVALRALRDADIRAERLTTWMRRMRDYQPGMLLPWGMLASDAITEGAGRGASGGDGLTFRTQPPPEPDDAPSANGDSVRHYT